MKTKVDCSDCDSAAPFVTLRGGLVADVMVVVKLLELERRGCRFTLEPEGRFRVTPASELTPDDRAFLKLHRDEARRVLDYCNTPPDRLH
jgi:hypothetical protein